jgi:outer membrane protein assembly factor BamE (lipoprotein component of BamABCDE complex)
MPDYRISPKSVRFSLRTMFLLMTVAAVLLTAYLYADSWWPLDGLMLPNDRGTTYWANGYSDNGWRTVRVGMKRREVYDLLGPPLYVSSVTSDGESWTRSSFDGVTYQRRTIVFQGDTVVRKETGYRPFEQK